MMNATTWTEKQIATAARRTARDCARLERAGKMEQAAKLRAAAAANIQALRDAGRVVG